MLLLSAWTDALVGAFCAATLIASVTADEPLFVNVTVFNPGNASPTRIDPNDTDVGLATTVAAVAAPASSRPDPAERVSTVSPRSFFVTTSELEPFTRADLIS